MKLKQIMFGLVAVIAVDTVSASELYKGKVLSEKVWTSDGRATSAVTRKIVGQMPMRLDTSGLAVQSYLDSAAIKINENIVLGNRHFIDLRNSSGVTKTYKIFDYVCSFTTDANNHCAMYDKKIELSDGGYYYDMTAPQLEMSYAVAGRYSISMGTSVFEDDGSQGAVNSYASAVVDVA
jgi:hypothetical protein